MESGGLTLVIIDEDVRRVVVALAQLEGTLRIQQELCLFLSQSD